MSVFLGPFDPIKLIFAILNTLMSKGLITIKESRSILKEALNPSMSELEKENLLDSLTKGQDEKK